MALKGAQVKTALETQTAAVIEDTTQAHTGELPWAEAVQELEAAPAKQEVQVAQAATSVVPAKSSGQSFMAAVNAQSDGFDALDDEIGFGSFPMVKLDKNMFIIDKAEYKEFNCQILSARPKFVIKSSLSPDDEKLVYSYDKVESTSGKSLEALKKEWKAEGYPEPETSRYMECAAKFLSDGPHKDRIVLLNVAPASVKRLGGYRAELQLTGRSMANVATRVFAGDKITLSPKVNFYPWNFEEAK